MQRSRKVEIMAGVFVLLALGLIIFLTFLIRGTTGLSPYVLKTQFDNVAGLDIGSPVLVSGFRLGRITEMEEGRRENGEATVTVIFKVASEMTIYKDATVTMGSLGFIGDKRLEIDPGTPDAEEVENGDMLESVPPESFDELIAEGKQVMAEVNNSVKRVNELLNDEERIARIDRVLANIEKITQDMDQVVQENRQSIRQTTQNMQTASQRSLEIADKAEQLLNRSEQSVQTIEETMNRVASDFNAQTQRISARTQQVVDAMQETADNTNAFIDNADDEIDSVSQALRDSAGELQKLVKAINEGQGTAGLLATDPQPFEDLRDSIAALKATLLRENIAPYNREIDYVLKSPEKTPQEEGANSASE